MATSTSPQRPSRDKAPSAVTPYGLWPSPIDVGQVARQATAYDAVHTSGEAVYWLETRPAEDGGPALRRPATGVLGRAVGGCAGAPSGCGRSQRAGGASGGRVDRAVGA